VNTTQTAEDLYRTAVGYTHTPESQTLLEPYKGAVLLLRAKYASYEKITEVLKQHGIAVSSATVRRLCRRQYAEVKRLRQGLTARQGDQPPAPLPAVSTASPAAKSRNLRGPV
jgi:hypothetical protein